MRQAERNRVRGGSIGRGAALLVAAGLSVAALLASAGGAAAQSLCADPSGGCAGTLPEQCLASLGAGAVSAKPECAEKLAAYRACLTQAATECAASPAEQQSGAALLGPAARGFVAALKREMEDNLAKLRELRDRMDLTGGTAIYEDGWPELSRRVIGATSNPAYFTAPTDWLAKAENLYEEADGVIGSKQVRNAYRRQVTSVLYERRLAREALEAIIARGETELLPEFDGYLR